MPKQSIASQWDTFRILAVPAAASQGQVREMRRAFYAGVEAFRRLMFDLPDNEEAGMQMLDELQAELVDFAAAVEKGHA